MSEFDCGWVQDEEDETIDEYKEKVLQAIRDFEKKYDPVEQYEITYAIGILYEIIRGIQP